jgi:hypothetical protein
MPSKHILLSVLLFVFTLGIFAPVLLADGEYHSDKGGAAPVVLVKSFEDLLHRQEGLLHSFESLVNLYHVPPMSLLKSYEDLLRRQALLMESFAQVTEPYACGPMEPEFKLIESFESLLHGQMTLLMSFEGLIHKLPQAPMSLIQSFEDLIRRQANLVKSFEGMLHCLTEMHHASPRELYPFITSFEDLIRSQSRLLMSFAVLVKSAGGMDIHDMDMMPPPSDDQKDHDTSSDNSDQNNAPPADDSKHDDNYGHQDDSDHDYSHDGKDGYDKSDDHHDGYDKPEMKYTGSDLPDLRAIMEFAKQGMYLVQYNHIRDMLMQRSALQDRSVAMIQNFKLMIQDLNNQGKHDAALYATKQLDEFRLNLSKLQNVILKKSLEVTIVPAGDEDEDNKSDDSDTDYHQFDGQVKLIVSNNGPFTIDMASFAVFHDYKMVATMSLGTLEPGEHKIIKLKMLDPYMLKLVKESSVVTGFISMFSKFFQAAMME